MEYELKNLFEETQKEFIHLYFRWLDFVQIFGYNQHRIDILNQTSSNLLIHFHKLVLDNMMLNLSKLTDPAKTRGNNNLSLPHLIDYVEKTDKNEIVPELKEILNALNVAVEKFRQIRNKKIAHNDLKTALGKDDFPLPSASRADIDNALKLTSNFLNKIEFAFFNKTTFYELSILPLDSDGRSLLIRLQKSLAYDKLERDGVVKRGMWRELGNID